MGIYEITGRVSGGLDDWMFRGLVRTEEQKKQRQETKKNMKNKAIFLDRDGIINKPVIRNNKPFTPENISEFEFTDGIREVLKELKRLEFLLFVVTNQADVSRGKRTKENVEEISKFIVKELLLDKVYCCYHDNKDNCECRKPKPGMLLTASKEYNVDLAKSYFVGDRWSDIEAGKNAGCKTIFVDYGYDEKLKSKPDFSIKSVSEISRCIGR